MAESKGAILTAIGANLAIAAAKFAGFALTGASAMASEGVHSLVDSANEGLLLLGLHRAARPADANHPFGHGREVYFYSFVVALFIFLAGGVYSIVEGIEKTLHPEAVRDALVMGIRLPGVAVNLVVLLFALAAEGYSLYVALASLPKGGGSPLSAIRRSKDPSLFVVVAEDAAACAGLAVAILGVALATGLDLPALDGVASIGIGLVLVGMAAFLMVETHGLLIGEAADPAIVEALEALVRDEPAVRRIHEVLTQHFGPRDVLVNVSLDARDEVSAGDIEALVGRLDEALKRRHTAVTRIFVEVQSRESFERSRDRRAQATQTS